ncbi:MAG: hypothetical protein II453_18415 [Alphaproteobacteria bacterium]|nr:hypothetical protein [Alphaproteobacteria bacterium]
MANRYNNWQKLLEIANEDLKKYGVIMKVKNHDGDYSLLITYQDYKIPDTMKEFVGDIKDDVQHTHTECYAENYYEYELGDLVNDGWAHARAKVKAE